jgi:amicyanin
MHQFSTSLRVPVVAAGTALLVGAAMGIVVGTATAAPTPGAAAPASVVAERVMPGTSAASEAVIIQNFAFSPATVTIKVGTTLTWTNRDQDPHTVSATSGAFHSPTLSTGQSYQYTFTTPGRFDYLCTIHPFMTATVVVTP